MTLRQREVFDFIENYIAEAGYAPTIAEIAEGFGLSGKAIYDHVNAPDSQGHGSNVEKITCRGGLKLTAFAQLFSVKAQADIQHLGVQKGDVLTVSPAASPVVGDRVLTTQGKIAAFQKGQQIVGKVVGAIASIRCGGFRPDNERSSTKSFSRKPRNTMEKPMTEERIETLEKRVTTLEGLLADCMFQLDTVLSQTEV